MPFTRPRSAADIMTRSLLPTLDGLTFGLSSLIKYELSFVFRLVLMLNQFQIQVLHVQLKGIQCLDQVLQVFI